MKRVRFAFALLGLVAVLSICALWNQKLITDRLISACDELIVTYNRGDTDACHIAAERFNADLEKQTYWFPFFLRHERMEDIFYQASTLPHILQDDDSADFLSVVASVRMQLEVLLDNEWPLLQNIF